MIWASDQRLAPFLSRDYVGVQYESGPARWLEPPVALVSLIVTLKGPIRVGKGAVPNAWIGGLGGECETVTLGPAHTSVDVKLTPAGFFALTGQSPRELVGCYIEPGEVFGRRGRLLEEQLNCAQTWEQRYAVLDRLLVAHARDLSRPHPLVLEAYSLLQQTSGAISTDALADAVGYSRRHVTAVFHEQIGLPPKTVARLLRFERVCARLRGAPARWADIAADSGYCDQAHLNRDFRQLAGTTPSRFIGALAGRPAIV